MIQRTADFVRLCNIVPKAESRVIGVSTLTVEKDAPEVRRPRETSRPTSSD